MKLHSTKNTDILITTTDKNTNRTNTLIMAKKSEAATPSTRKVSIANRLTVPGVYGQFSSHSIEVVIDAPAPEEAFASAEAFKQFADNLVDLEISYAKDVINQVCEANGLPLAFEHVDHVDGHATQTAVKATKAAVAQVSAESIADQL